MIPITLIICAHFHSIHSADSRWTQTWYSVNSNSYHCEPSSRFFSKSSTMTVAGDSKAEDTLIRFRRFMKLRFALTKRYWKLLVSLAFPYTITWISLLDIKKVPLNPSNQCLTSKSWLNSEEWLLVNSWRLFQGAYCPLLGIKPAR